MFRNIVSLVLLDRMCVFRRCRAMYRINPPFDLFRRQYRENWYQNRFEACSHNKLVLHERLCDKCP